MLKDTIHKGFVGTYSTNGTHSPGSLQFFVANVPTGEISANGQPIYELVDVPTSAIMYSTNHNGSLSTEMKLAPGTFNVTSANATLDNVTVWSANSILTRDYADTRYAAISATIDGGTALTTNTGSYDGGDAIAN
jgi:hypothetical protein